MGLFNFKRQFKPYILDGSKQHTIRAPRRYETKPGDLCHLYVGLRQPGAELLGRAPCPKVEPIMLGHRTGNVPCILISDELLDDQEANALAWRDGFRDLRGGQDTHLELMFSFWTGRLPFEGTLTHWNWKDRQQ